MLARSVAVSMASTSMRALSESGQHAEALWASGSQKEAALVLVSGIELNQNFEPIPAELWGKAFGPLYRHHGLGIDDLVNADVGEVAGADTVEVEVIEGRATVVLVDEGEAGAGDRVLDP
jgi:hypothetical protein